MLPMEHRDSPRPTGGLFWVIIATLVVSPLLLFPEILSEWMREFIVVPVCIGSMLASLRMSAALPTLLRFWMCAFMLLVVAGWFALSNDHSSLSHFAGLTAGLLWLVVLSSQVTSTNVLRIAVIGYLVLSSGFVAFGLLGTEVVSGKYLIVPQSWSDALPSFNLPLPGLPDSGKVNPNAVSAAALLALPLSLSMLGSPCGRDRLKRLLRLVSAGCAVLAIIAMVLTQSRSALLAVTTMVCFSVYYGLAGRARLLVFQCLIVVAVAPVVWLSQSDPRTFQRTKSALEKRVAERATLLRGGAVLLAESPAFGIGLNRFRYHYSPPAQSGMDGVPHVHNVFLQTALDVGLVGLALYCALVGGLLVAGRRAWRTASGLVRAVSRGTWLTVVGIHAFGLSDAVALGAKLGVLQWAACGLLLACVQLERRSDGSVGPSSE